ncbi:tetratricopeptide repeat protein [Methyloversatilis sp. XJ19-13]|uniref:tetratricopeptide repeat protein n=1 Tax=Methyloversatilis sp. XJ19-13 TaxID=2963430 RepID=UPI00211CED5C|nr:tetratricopeptide repeat protein [Methyloversatilis sp. XJ19-13]MCQ9375625.1 tetratricopeptide repeat protein [Methyloversatilis sp. XJ19-13]
MPLRTITDLTVSGASPRSLELLELAEHQFRCFIGDPVATVSAALEESPDMVMGHVLLAYLMLLGTEPAGLPVASAACRRAEKLPANAREARHVRAVDLLVSGRLRAAARVLEDIAIEHPLDTLALQAGHQTDFLLGDSRMLRDRIARALPAWHTDMPAWHAVAGMLAFGLEETGDYERAEQYGRQAVERQPRDGWAQHAVAHVMEMQNRRHDGIAWMRAAPQAWALDNFLSVHNHWHLALFHLGLDDIDAVLALYDGPVCAEAPGLVFDLVDQSALLWRLHLRGIDVGTRWQALADRWSPNATTGRYAFNDMHATMAFAAAGRTEQIRAIADAQQAVIAGSGDSDADNIRFTAEVGHAATTAMAAFADGDYAQTVDLLRPIRHISHRFGGSHAQRDVLDLTLIEAAARDGQQSLATALRAERALQAGRALTE